MWKEFLSSSKFTFWHCWWSGALHDRRLDLFWGNVRQLNLAYSFEFVSCEIELKPWVIFDLSIKKFLWKYTCHSFHFCIITQNYFGQMYLQKGEKIHKVINELDQYKAGSEKLPEKRPKKQSKRENKNMSKIASNIAAKNS